MLQDRGNKGHPRDPKRGRKGDRKPAARPRRYTRGGWALGRRGEDYVAEFRGDQVGPGKHGKRVRIGPCETPEEARRKFDVWVDRLALLGDPTKKRTCADLWSAWLQERAADGYPNKVHGFNWRALAPHFGHLMPAAITSEDCRAYARARFDQGIAPATVHTELVRLRACLRWAEGQRLIERAPKIWAPSKGKPRNTVLTREEAVAIMAAAKRGDPHIAVFTALLFCTGARHHAICELTWDRIDFVAGTINYNVDVERDPMSKAYTKGRAIVLISRTAREVLIKAYLGRQTEFVIEHGGRRVKDVRRGFANAVKRAGITKRITPHTIRHSIITWLQEGKTLTRHTAQLVGHGDETTTRLHYTHMGPDSLREVVDTLDAVFGALPTSADEEAEKRRSEELFRSITSRLGRDESDTHGG